MDHLNQDDLQFLCESGVITTEEKNLRSKVESISRSLKQLSEKRLRLDFEIKRQRKSLARKREELKRVSKRTSAKLSLALETGELNSRFSPEEDVKELRRYDDNLLRESSLLLED